MLNYVSILQPTFRLWEQPGIVGLQAAADATSCTLACPLHHRKCSSAHLEKRLAPLN